MPPDLAGRGPGGAQQDQQPGIDDEEAVAIHPGAVEGHEPAHPIAVHPVEQRMGHDRHRGDHQQHARLHLGAGAPEPGPEQQRAGQQIPLPEQLEEREPEREQDLRAVAHGEHHQSPERRERDVAGLVHGDVEVREARRPLASVEDVPRAYGRERDDGGVVPDAMGPPDHASTIGRCAADMSAERLP